MAIKLITPTHLNQISNGIAKRYTPTLDKQIQKNPGVVSVEHGDTVSAFALYQTKQARYIKIFELDGDERGIKEIVNYFISRMQWEGRKRGSLFIEVPYDRFDLLNVLKSIKVNDKNLFSFHTENDKIVATYPPSDKKSPSGGFKKFIEKPTKPKNSSNNDEYGLFDDLPWRDQ